MKNIRILSIVALAAISASADLRVYPHDPSNPQHYTDGGGRIYSGGYAPTHSTSIIPKSTIEVVTPPTELDPTTPNQYFVIDEMIFSDDATVRPRYGVKSTTDSTKWDGVMDFIVGVNNTWKLRVRNLTTRFDVSGEGSIVTWNNGSFTGGNTRYSPGGYRVYGSGGSLIMQYKNGAYASLKINIDSTIVPMSTNPSMKFWLEDTKICFRTYHVSKSCVTYLMRFRAR